MRGKNKCKILKQIRQKIADENDIPLVTKECGFQGECSGTCPRCEAELRYLEQQLARRQQLGKAVTVAALSVSLMTGLTACPSQTLEGEVPFSPDTGSLTQETEAGIPVETEENRDPLNRYLGYAPPSSDEQEYESLELMGDVAYLPTEDEPFEFVGVPTLEDEAVSQTNE